MSHFIQGVEVDQNLDFYSKPNQIVKPRVLKYRKLYSLANLFDVDSEKHIIDLVCNRYSNIESEKHKGQRQNFIYNKCQAIKKKFKSSLNPNSNGITVKKYFKQEKLLETDKQQQMPMNLKKMAENMPHRIQLQKKYNTSINIKMASIKQALMINKQKQNYKNWINQSKTCTNTPNFNKIVYILEKLGKGIDSQWIQAERDKNKGKKHSIEEFSKNVKHHSKLDFLLDRNQKQYKKKERKNISQVRTRNRHSSTDCIKYKI